jgi:hypothetical protein
VAFERPHCVLYNEGMVTIGWHEVRDGRDWIHWGPV